MLLSYYDKISPKRIAIMYIQQDLGGEDAGKENWFVPFSVENNDWDIGVSCGTK